MRKGQEAGSASLTPKQYVRKFGPPKDVFVKDGYPCFFAPRHPLAQASGLVRLRRHEKSVERNSWLRPDEKLYHLGGRGSSPRDETTAAYFQVGRPLDLEEVQCGHEACGKRFRPSSHREYLCSPGCAQLVRRRFDVSRKALHRAVWSMPTVDVARTFGVSDTAIGKRCRRLGIEKPPRGYWARVEAGKLENVVPPLKEE